MLNQKMKQDTLDGFGAWDACQEVQPEDTVQNLTRVDTGAESSDSQGREARPSDGRGVGSGEGKAQHGVR